MKAMANTVVHSFVEKNISRWVVIEFMLFSCMHEDQLRTRYDSHLQIRAKIICTQSQTMSGVLTGCILKHLSTPYLELGEFTRLVVQGVIDLKGRLQMPVREG